MYGWLNFCERFIRFRFQKAASKSKKNITFFCWKSRCYTFSWIKYCYDAIINYLHNELVVRWWMEINPLLCAYTSCEICFGLNTYWHCCPNRCITWQGWNMIRPRAFIIVVLFDFMQILGFFSSSSNQGIEIWEQFK